MIKFTADIRESYFDSPKLISWETDEYATVSEIIRIFEKTLVESNEFPSRIRNVNVPDACKFKAESEALIDLMGYIVLRRYVDNMVRSGYYAV